jgi:signal transduction histidine kinase
MSKLAQFIRDNTEEILSEWEAFARGIEIAERMDVVTLRDHAKEMLTVVACELEEPEAQSGEPAVIPGAPRRRVQETAAEEHGAGRAESGFSVGEMVSEFRALRASVVRLWLRRLPQVDFTDVAELARFHDAMDQLISESVTRFSEQVKQSKERFLAILGHDLRSPLGAIMTSSAFLLETAKLEESQMGLLNSIARSAGRMNDMVKDLLDFARTRFGDRIPIERKDLDLHEFMDKVVAEVRASAPDRKVEVQTSGDLRGRWDADRLAQVLTNLLGNAVEHGTPGTPINLTAHGEQRDVQLSVQSRGPTIPEKDLRHILQGMKDPEQDGKRDRRHLGLGLYIVDKIVAAHGGSVDVRSSDESGTTFTVRLPRVG